MDAKQVGEHIFTEPQQVQVWRYMINPIRIQLKAWLMKYKPKDKRVFYLEFSCTNTHYDMIASPNVSLLIPGHKHKSPSSSDNVDDVSIAYIYKFN